MNLLKSKKSIAIFVGIIAVAGLALIIAFTSNALSRSPEEEKIIAAVKQFDQIEDRMEPLPVDILIENAEKGTSYLYNDEQAEQTIEKRIASFPENLSESDRTYFTEKVKRIIGAQANVSFPEDEYASFTIGAGTLNYDVKDIKIDGDSATVELSKDGWLLAINREEGSPKYIVWLIYSRFSGTEEMKIEDGQWVLSEDDTDQVFAPDDYNYNKGEYDTFLEALNASQELDPAGEDPFE